MAASATTLGYGTRQAFVQGLDDLIAKPSLAMENECAREQAWTDWRGRTYSLATEWKYVAGLDHPHLTLTLIIPLPLPPPPPLAPPLPLALPLPLSLPPTLTLTLTLTLYP